jgi:hypothetical protein
MRRFPLLLLGFAESVENSRDENAEKRFSTETGGRKYRRSAFPNHRACKAGDHRGVAFLSSRKIRATPRGALLEALPGNFPCIFVFSLGAGIVSSRKQLHF